MMRNRIYYTLMAKKRMSKIYLCSPKKFDGCEFLPMIEFKRVTNSLDLDRFDAIIFTSKQAIVYTNEINSSWKNKKILAVGKATAKIASELGATDIYNPKEFYGRELAKDIIDRFNNLKIIYLRPKIVAFDSVDLLQKFGIDASEKVIYETNCVKYKDKELEKNSIIIFTSPSTIKCFFNSFKWDKSYKAIVIGKTTLKALDSGIQSYIANTPTIASCVEKAQEISKIL